MVRKYLPRRSDVIAAPVPASSLSQNSSSHIHVPTVHLPATASHVAPLALTTVNQSPFVSPHPFSHNSVSHILLPSSLAPVHRMRVDTNNTVNMNISNNARNAEGKKYHSSSTNATEEKQGNNNMRVISIFENDDCCVCGRDHSEDDNQILFCDYCDIPVHQYCYGLQKIPEGDWFCDSCTLCNRAPNQKKPVRRCAVCPCRKMPAAFKLVNDARSPGQPPRWIHVVCVLWFDELSFTNNPRLESPAGFEFIYPGRKDLVCCICDARGGCIQCTWGKCAQSFHAQCARLTKKEFVMDLPEEGNDGEEDIPTKAFCKKHSRLHRLGEICPPPSVSSNNNKKNKNKAAAKKSSSHKHHHKSVYKCPYCNRAFGTRAQQRHHICPVYSPQPKLTREQRKVAAYEKRFKHLAEKEKRTKSSKKRINSKSINISNTNHVANTNNTTSSHKNHKKKNTHKSSTNPSHTPKKRGRPRKNRNTPPNRTDTKAIEGISSTTTNNTHSHARTRRLERLPGEQSTRAPARSPADTNAEGMQVLSRKYGSQLTHEMDIRRISNKNSHSIEGNNGTTSSRSRTSNNTAATNNNNNDSKYSRSRNSNSNNVDDDVRNDVVVGNNNHKDSNNNNNISHSHSITHARPTTQQRHYTDVRATAREYAEPKALISKEVMENKRIMTAFREAYSDIERINILSKVFLNGDAAFVHSFGTTYV